MDRKGRSRFAGRREDHRFLTGQGQYTSDGAMHAELYAAFRRSDVAAASIKRISIDESAACKGVHAVLLGRNPPSHTRAAADRVSSPRNDPCSPGNRYALSARK